MPVSRGKERRYDLFEDPEVDEVGEERQEETIFVFLDAVVHLKVQDGRTTFRSDQRLFDDRPEHGDAEVGTVLVQRRDHDQTPFVVGVVDAAPDGEVVLALVHLGSRVGVGKPDRRGTIEGEREEGVGAIHGFLATYGVSDLLGVDELAVKPLLFFEEGSTFLGGIVGVVVGELQARLAPSQGRVLGKLDMFQIVFEQIVKTSFLQVVALGV